MKIKFQLILILFFTLIANQVNSQEHIPVKPVILSVPQIDSTYSIVHSSIYPKNGDNRFNTNTPPDFFVQKILKNKPKESKQIQTINSQNQNNGNPSPTMPAEDIQITSQNSQQKQPKRNPISTSLLAQNSKQNIAWAVPKLNPLNPFVVQNGIQHKIVQAIPENPPKMEFSQEGKPAVKPPTQNVQKPITTQTKQPQPKPKPLSQAQLQLQSDSQSKPKAQASPAPELKQKVQSNKQVQQQQGGRFDKHRSNLIWIIFGALILIAVFVIIRSQRKTKTSSLSILHSRLDSYKIQLQDQDQSQISKNNSSLQDDSGSDEQNEDMPSKFYGRSIKL